MIPDCSYVKGYHGFRFSVGLHRLIPETKVIETVRKQLSTKKRTSNKKNSEFLLLDMQT